MGTQSVMRKVHSALVPPFNIANSTLNIGASIGYAHYPDDGLTMDDLCLVADQKMYLEKQAPQKTHTPLSANLIDH